MVSPQACLDGIHELSLIISESLPCGPGAERQSVRSRALLATLQELQVAADILFSSRGKDCMIVADVLESVRSLLKKLGVVGSQSAQGSSSSRTDVSDAPSWLQSLVNTLRTREPTFAFQQQLHVDKQRAARRHNCSVDQLTYGTTSWTFFRRVLQSPEVAHAMRPSPVPTRCAIFGSSTGLLSFFTAALYPHACVDGFEVLPCLVTLATKMRDTYCNTNASNSNNKSSGFIAFHLKDMLSADISQCSLVILTSLCFDKRTRRAVYSKLSSECPRGCIVVDYQDGFKEFGLEARAGRYGMGVGSGLFTSPQQAQLERAVSKSSVAALQGALEAVLETYEDQLRNPSTRARFKFALTAVLDGEVSWSRSGAQKIFVFRAEM